MMKIEEQVCTLEQAKRLKELGVAQIAYFGWCGDENHIVMDDGRRMVNHEIVKENPMTVGKWVWVGLYEPPNNQERDYREDVNSAKPFAAAFNVAELGEMLPHPSSLNQLGGWLHNSEFDDSAKEKPWYLIWETADDGKHSRQLIDGNTEAEARAAILIYLLEYGVITAEQVNKRLSQ